MTAELLLCALLLLGQDCRVGCALYDAYELNRAHAAKVRREGGEWWMRWPPRNDGQPTYTF